MSKRTHDEINSSEFTPRALRLQRLQLSGLLDQSKNSLFRSLKVARGFERQKLGRRQKTAKTESNATATTARLEAEVAALKSLDLASTAEIYLYKSVLKFESVASAPAFPHHVQATIDASKKPQEAASANVQARLFKSGPVQAAMTEALKGIQAVLGIEELKLNGKRRMRAKDYANGSPAKNADGPDVSKRDGSSVSTTRAQDEEEWSGFSAHESLENEQYQAFLDDDDYGDVDYDMCATRLAGSSDEESIGENAKGQDHVGDKLNDLSITEDEAEGEESHEEEDQDHDDSDTQDADQPSTKP
ncbi:MAG: hypothetical protein Q9175_006153, partial [Cornicularia normoerica]